MEAVPRLPMISFHLKVSPEPVSFGPKLKHYIREFYKEDAESYSNEIHQLESLRAMAVRPPIDVTGCSLLKKYYCQLHFLDSRFPMKKDGAAAITFTWRDTYANMVCSLANIRFEIISILYNVGAIHTQLGARTERTTAEGMKMACAHFQCAAWAFEHLKNSYPQPPGVDLAPELMTFMHQLCLAQAQECILEKSMLDNRKPTIVAKVARQIVDYYNLALSTLEQGGTEDSTVSDTVGTKIYKSWKRYVKFKRAYHLAVTQLYQGLAAEEQQKMGERVAFYNAALASLNEARALYGNAKGSGITSVAEEKEAIEDALTFTNDVIEGKRKAAKNENEFIYHEEIPEKDTLPTVKGASLVKGISFNVNDPEVSGPDIFARLIPMKVHAASSIYSEEKGKLLRSIRAKIEERDQQLNIYLASLKLDNMSLWDPDRRSSESDRMPLPEELAERCAALNAKPNAIQDLVDAMGKLADTYHDVESMLKEIGQLLAEEQQREKKYQDAMGKRPPSIVATDLTREAKKYEEAHAKASESNQALHRAMTLHVNNLRILAQPLADLMAHIPSPKVPNSAQEGGKKPEDVSVGCAKEFKRILNKVDEMRRQRSELHAQLRDAIAQDDLTQMLVTAVAEGGSLDSLFAEQISKHQKFVNLIDQNLAAQDNILAALTDAYAHTADMRKTVDEVLKRREIMISSLISSYDAYEDLLAKSSKGLEFYRKLETNVSKLLQRVKSTCKVQEEEREQILAQNDKATYNVPEGTVNALPNVESQVLPSSSGLKLKDYLASRQKPVVPTYQNQYYDRHTGQVSQVQSIPVASTETVANQVVNPTMTMAPAELTAGDPKHSYGYYTGGYGSYYTPQPVEYSGQYQYGENNSVSSNINQSFPRSGTTNTASMYHQAGGATSTTEVASNANQYAGYSVLPNGQTQYPSTSNIQTGATMHHSMYPQTGTMGANPSMPDASNVLPVSYSATSSAILPTSSSSYLQQTNMMQPVQGQPVQQMHQNYTDPTQSTYSDQAARNYADQTQQSYGDQTQHAYVDQSHLNYPDQTQLNYTDPTQISYADQTQQSYIDNMAQQGNVMGAQAQANQVVQGYTNAYGNYAQGVSGHQYLPQNSLNPVAGSQNYSLASHANNSEIIQSHAKSSSVQNYPQNYQYAQYNPGLYSGTVQYPGYSQGYANTYGASQANNMSNTIQTDSYKGHPGYSYDPVAGGYQYSSGYQDSRIAQMQRPTGTPPAVQQTVVSGGYDQQENIARYTNANNDVGTNQTPSTQYSDPAYQLPASSQSYYTAPYGIQGQTQSTSDQETVNQNGVNNTYMQASNNETSTTTSGNTEKSEKTESSKPKSNVDLLADLDITINHAPLVPEIHSTEKVTKDESTTEKTLSADAQDHVKDDDASSDSGIRLDERNDNLQIVWDTWYTDVQPKKDPLGDSAVLQKFAIDIEKYEKFIDGLLAKTLSGATTLDLKWKEVRDFQEREATKQTTKLAQINPTANRVADCVPYDSTIVKLLRSDITSTYINASHVRDITQWTPAAFIVTQAPMQQTFETFWTMVWEQGSEVIACLASDAQLNGDIYWPTDENKDLTLGSFAVSLKNRVNHTNHIQRIFSIAREECKTQRTVVHMQFVAWPSNGFPSSPGPLLAFTTDVISEQALRRCAPRPIVVHCLTGGTLSGLFLLAAATVCHVRVGRGIVDVALVFSTLVKFRKCLVDKDSLLFGYRMVLYHAQDALMKRGILSSTRSTFEGFEGVKGALGKVRKKTQHRHPAEDFLHNLGVGMQHDITGSQGGKVEAGTENTSQSSSTNFQEKPEEVKPIDPLSQLDPMWSIRR